MAGVQIAENAWNTRNAAEVVRLCSPDCIWQNQDSFFQGHAAIAYFLKNKWSNETQAKQQKELWAFTDNRISVHFECEWQQDETNQWFRTFGTEHWEFDADGYMSRRDMSANDIPIAVNRQRFNR